MNIVLYTTHCPKCKVLEQKLKDKKVEYCICEDIDEMTAQKLFETNPKAVVENGRLKISRPVGF